MIYIYALCDPDTDEVRYVGKTQNLEVRYKAHLQHGHPNTYRKSWIMSLVKSGRQPLMRVLEETSENSWREREIWWIAEMRRQGFPLTNLTDGGDGVTNLVHSEASKQKMSVAKKILLSNPEERQKISARSKGRAITEKHRLHLSQVNIGRKATQEARANISRGRKGMQFTTEHNANISRGRKGIPAHNKGKSVSEDQKLSVSLAQRKLTEKHLDEIRSLLQSGQYTGRQIAQMYNVSPSTITGVKQGLKYFEEREK